MSIPSLKTTAALATILVGMCAWYGVVYLHTYVVETATQYQVRASAARNSTAREAAQARIRALTTETAAKRASLSAFVQADPIAAAKAIESVGAAARISLKVSGASPEVFPIPAAASAHPLKAVGFVIEATGTFAGVMKALHLLETLPLPITMVQFDIAQVPTDASQKGAPQWRLNARMRLLTDSTLSSS
jgi:hypothetical protein